MLNGIYIPASGAPDNVVFPIDDHKTINKYLESRTFNRIRVKYLDSYNHRISIFVNADQNDSLKENALASRIAKQKILGNVVLINGNKWLLIDHLRTLIKQSSEYVGNVDNEIITLSQLESTTYYGVKLSPNGATEEISFVLSDINRTHPRKFCRIFPNYRITIFARPKNYSPRVNNKYATKMVDSKIYGDIIITDDEKKLTTDEVNNIIKNDTKLGMVIDINEICHNLNSTYVN